MRIMVLCRCVFTLLLFQQVSQAQNVVDSLRIQTTNSTTFNLYNASNNSKLNYKSMIIPASLLGFAIIGLESETIKNINGDVKSELREHIDEKITIDDFSQYFPFVSVYGLDAAGIKAKHNFKDRTIILGTAYLITGTSVTIIKNTGSVERPDGTSNNSFPSGHTATAFMGAEFLFQEYKDTSIWYGIAGFAVATGTGFFRMYYDRHWLTDVAAGAGIGILSTKIAYAVHPYLKKKIFKDKLSKVDGVALPFYNGKEAGIGMLVNF